MAKSPKHPLTKVIPPVVSKSAKSPIEKQLNDIDIKIYGEPITKLKDSTTATQLLVQSTIGNIEKTLVDQGIDDPVARSSDLMTAIRLEDDRRTNRDDKATKDGKEKAFNQQGGPKSVSDVLNTLNKEIKGISSLSQLFAGEETRLTNYALLKQISEFIVEVREAGEAYTDNIIAPDNFNTDAIPIQIKANNGIDKDAAEQVKSRIKLIDKKYDLSNKIQTAISWSLLLGDYFLTSIPAKRIIAQALTEEAINDAATNTFTPRVSLAEFVAVMSKEVPEKILSEAYDQTTHKMDSNLLAGLLGEPLQELSGEDKEAYSGSDALTDFISLMEGVVSFQEDTNAIAETQNKFIRSTDTIAEKYARRRGSKGKGGIDPKALELKSNFGSIVRTYPPDRVVKITDGNIVFGYLLVDILEQRGNSFGDKCSSNTFEQRFSDSIDGGKMSVAHRYITLFSQAVYRKFKIETDVNEIEKYSGFADVLASLLTRAKSQNKRFTVTFAYPSEVHHFKPSTDMFGTSILESVKLFARLYIGVLTNAFMSNAIRKSERIAYYIDVGGDDDPNNSVANVIRSIKQREAKFTNMNDITSTIAAAGEFHDFFIPTINGTRAIDIEPISLGTPREIDSDFIEFLKKSIVAGTGVPKAYLGSLEEIEFARSLTMENGRFLRRVVRKQRIYEDPISEAYREVYRNEYVCDDDTIQRANLSPEAKDAAEAEAERKQEDLLNSEIAVASIEIALPVPVTLSIQIQQDQIQNVDNQAELLADNQVAGEVSTEDEDMAKRLFKKSLVRHLMPGYDWELIDRLMKEAASKIVEIKQSSIVTPASTDADPASDM